MATNPAGYERSRADARMTPTPMADAGDFGAQVGQAISRVGDTMHRSEISAYQVERRQAADQEAADFNARFAAARERMDRLSVDMRNNAAPGAAGHADAIAAAWSKEQEGLLQGLTETRLIQNARAQMGEFGSRLRSSEYQYEQGARIGKVVADYGNTESAGANRILTAPNDDAYAEETRIADAGLDAMQGIPADVREKLRTATHQRYAIARINRLNRENPNAAVALIDAGAFNDTLTPEQLEQARRGSEVELRRDEAEKRQAFNLAKSEAQTQVEEILQMGRDGQPLSQAQIDQVGGLIQQYDLKGKTYDFVKISAENDVRRVTQKLSPQAIADQRNVLAAKVAKAGADAAPSDVASLAEMDRQLSRRRSEVRNDPFGYAARVGIAVSPLDMDDPRSIRSRLATVANIERTTGERVGLYQPDEARQLAALASGGVAGREQAAQQLGRWGGQNALKAAKQVAPNDFGLQHALLISPEVQRQIFQGEELRKGNAQLAPHAVIASAMRDAAGLALKDTPAWYRNGVLYNAGNLYAYMASNKGLLGKDEFDPILFRTAVNLTLDDTGRGGIGTYGQGANKAKVKLPYGVRQELFDKRIARIGGLRGFHHADRSPIPVEELKRDYHPVATFDPGIYYWVNKRGEYAVEPDGKRPARMNLSDDHG